MGQTIKQLVSITSQWHVDSRYSSKIETKTSVGWNEFWNEFWQLSNYLCADNRFIWLQWKALFQVNQLLHHHCENLWNAWRWKISSACHKKVLSRVVRSVPKRVFIFTFWVTILAAKGSHIAKLGSYFMTIGVPISLLADAMQVPGTLG